MSKRAEQRAWEFYPMKDYNKEPNYLHSCDSKMLDEVYREVFMIGYELAEKDLTLTWEDMQLIWQLCDTLNSEQPNLCGSKDFFTEVLNRFNKSKEEE